jgi:NADH dehydrogenase
MNVFVTGGSGFVGRAVIQALLAKDHSVHALVNHRKLTQNNPRLQSFTGSLFDEAAVDSAMQGCDAVIHLVGIIKEKLSKQITFDRIHYQGTKQMLAAARRAGIKRYVQMSALGASPTAASQYQQTKYLAQQAVRASDLDWTIIQPSLIHGPGGDFTEMEKAWARGSSPPYFFMPYFGSGLLGTGTQTKIQPVFVEDVARAFVESLDNPQTIGELYALGGPDQMTWRQMHEIAAAVIVGHPRPAIGIPAWYAKAITHIVPPAILPFTRDQVLMAQTDNTCDLTKFTTTFGWTPQPFEQTLKAYTNA